MKKAFLAALTASLALNVTSAWIFFSLREEKPIVAPSDIAPPVAAPAIDAHLWPELKTEDMPTLINRLRAAGFPPEIVRAVLRVQLDELFARRRRTLVSPQASTAFWKSLPRNPKADLALRELDREEQKMLADLMGDAPLPGAFRNPALAFLPSDKADAIQRLEVDYAGRRSDLWTGGFNESTDRDKFKALDQQMHDALAQRLTPDELQEYDLRMSKTADRLRERLAAFDPTEAEYRAIYPLEAAFNDKWGADYDITMPADQRAQRKEAEKQVAVQIKAALSPDRAAQYDRATDWDYINTSQLIERLELPPDTTDSLYSLAQEFDRRRETIYETKLSEADRAPRLIALQQEALVRANLLLGNHPGAIDAYQNHGGEWVKYIVPQDPTKN